MSYEPEKLHCYCKGAAFTSLFKRDAVILMHPFSLFSINMLPVQRQSHSSIKLYCTWKQNKTKTKTGFLVASIYSHLACLWISNRGQCRNSKWSHLFLSRAPASLFLQTHKGVRKHQFTYISGVFKILSNAHNLPAAFYLSLSLSARLFGCFLHKWEQEIVSFCCTNVRSTCCYNAVSAH